MRVQIIFLSLLIAFPCAQAMNGDDPGNAGLLQKTRRLVGKLCTQFSQTARETVVDVFSNQQDGAADGYFKEAHELFYESEYEQAVHKYLWLLRGPLAGLSDEEIIRAKVNCAEAYLGMGLWVEGFARFEARLSAHGRTPLRTPLTHLRLAKLLKSGGGTILFRAEHGLGDTCCFVRGIKAFHDAGIKTIAVVQSPLKQLIARCPYVDQTLDQKDIDRDGEPAFDYDLYMMSLFRFASNRGLGEGSMVLSVPNFGQYVFADPELTELWKSKIGAKKKVPMLLWHRSSDSLAGEFRMVDRKMWLESMIHALKTIPEVQLYCLRTPYNWAVTKREYAALKAASKGALLDRYDIIPDECLEQIDRFDESIHAGPGTMENTAAIFQAVKELDGYLLSTDTVFPNMAAAMHVKTIIFLPKAADWRWLLDRDDSPLHPTVTLLRQPKKGDWETPLKKAVVYLCMQLGRQQSGARRESM